MARSKIPSCANLQVSLLERIAEYKRKCIPVADLLPEFIEGVLDYLSTPEQVTSIHAQEHEWEQRSIDALRKMDEHQGWIYLEYRGDERLGEALATEPIITLENYHRFVVTIMKRGQVFLETRRNPSSKNSSSSSTRLRKVSQTLLNQSIADIVKGRGGYLKTPKTKLRRGNELLPRLQGGVASRSFVRASCRPIKDA